PGLAAFRRRRLPPVAPVPQPTAVAPAVTPQAPPPPTALQDLFAQAYALQTGHQPATPVAQSAFQLESLALPIAAVAAAAEVVPVQSPPVMPAAIPAPQPQAVLPPVVETTARAGEWFAGDQVRVSGPELIPQPPYAPQAHASPVSPPFAAPIAQPAVAIPEPPEPSPTPAPSAVAVQTFVEETVFRPAVAIETVAYQETPPAPMVKHSIFSVIEDDEEEDTAVPTGTHWADKYIQPKTDTLKAPVVEPRRDSIRSHPEPFTTTHAAPHAKPAVAAEQPSLKLQPDETGRFKDTEKTIVGGDDLDVPTWLRLRSKAKV
ncbi:MAG: hypothetical protein ACOYMN_19995, partial [Roseimicrobium sp.]